MAGDLDHGSSHRRPPAVTAYLAEIETRMPSRWTRARRTMLAELADGIDDAVEHYRDVGLSPERATARALTDCGPASTVADAITEVLGTAQARRTASTLLGTGPLIGLLWLTTLVPGRPPSALFLQRPAIAVLVVAAALLSALTILAGGPGGHRLPFPRLSPVRTAAAACASAAACDLLLLAAASPLLTKPEPPGLGPFAVVAVLASTARLGLTQRVARRDLS